MFMYKVVKTHNIQIQKIIKRLKQLWQLFFEISIDMVRQQFLAPFFVCYTITIPVIHCNR